MEISSPKRRSSVATALAIALAIWLALGARIWASAAPFNPAPLFERAEHFSTKINGDLADIYFPVPSNLATERDLFPTALILQGTNVDKSNYSRFADAIARYGFIVVVPNHLRKFAVVPGLARMGLLPDQQQVIDVLAHMKEVNSDPSSPIFSLLDPGKLVLLGHSMGGVAGLNAIQGTCVPPFCLGGFARPAELVGGVFYGTNLKGHFGKAIRPINNGGIPTALVQGSLDSQSKSAEAQATYNQIQNPPKALVTVLGTNHYGRTNSNNPANPPGIPPATPAPIAPTLDQAEAIETIARWSALFLRAHVLGDLGAFDYVHRTGALMDETVSVLSQTQPVPERPGEKKPPS